MVLEVPMRELKNGYIEIKCFLVSAEIVPRGHN